MNGLRRLRRFLGALALAAVFGLAIVPTLARALAYAAGGSALAEVCTPQGTQRVAADGSGPAAPAVPAVPMLDPCDVCRLAGETAAVPPATPARVLQVPAAYRRPPLLLHAPRTLFAWRNAQPRGPPAALA